MKKEQPKSLVEIIYSNWLLGLLTFVCIFLLVNSFLPILGIANVKQINYEFSYAVLISVIVASIIRQQRSAATVKKQNEQELEMLGKLTGRVRGWAESNKLVEVEKFDTREAFFEDLHLALLEAKRRVSLTAIREETPDHFLGGSAAQKWYQAIIDWAGESPGTRTVERVVAVSNPRMLAWAKDVKKQLNDQSIRNFQLYGIDWSRQNGFPVINICIFDDLVTYLIHTPKEGLITESRFVKINSKIISQFFYESYFRELKRTSTPVEADENPA